MSKIVKIGRQYHILEEPEEEDLKEIMVHQFI